MVRMVPDDNNTLDVLGHAFDQLEPFTDEGDRCVRAQVGRSQTAQDYQDIPLSIKVADAAQSFGIYFKFFVVLE